MAAPTILPADSGELQMAVPLLGLAHATGYPLYLLLGKLWTLVIPVGDLAYRVTLFSALAAAATLAGFSLLVHRWARPVPALIATATLLVSPTFWSQAIRAEVYALNSLLVMILISLALIVREKGWEDRAWPAFWLTLGLGLAHHRLVLLLLPALFLLLWPALRPLVASKGANHRPAPARQAALRPLLLAFLPLLLYLYIPLRGPVTPYLHLELRPGETLDLYDGSWLAFWELISGSLFRGSLHAPTGSDLPGRIGLWATLLHQQFGGLGIGLGLVGLVALARRGWGIAIGLLVAYLSVVAFCLVYFIGDIADLFTPSYLVFALWIGIGIEQLRRWAVGPVAPLPLARQPDDHTAMMAGCPTATWGGQRALSWIVLLITALLPLYLLVAHLPTHDWSQAWATREKWETLLARPLPTGAILLSNDRDEMTPLWYLRYVENRRPDLLGLFPLITPRPEHANIGRLAETALAWGRPVYLIKAMPGLDIKFDIATAPAESLWQVTGPAIPPETRPGRPADAWFGEQLRLWGAEVGTLTPTGTLTVTLYWEATGPVLADYAVFVHLVNAAGDIVAQSDQVPGGHYYPPTLWQTGERLRDRHRLPLKSALIPGHSYGLRVGLYHPVTLDRLETTNGADWVDLGPVVAFIP